MLSKESVLRIRLRTPTPTRATNKGRGRGRGNSFLSTMANMEQVSSGKTDQRKEDKLDVKSSSAVQSFLPPELKMVETKMDAINAANATNDEFTALSQHVTALHDEKDRERTNQTKWMDGLQARYDAMSCIRPGDLVEYPLDPDDPHTKYIGRVVQTYLAPTLFRVYWPHLDRFRDYEDYRMNFTKVDRKEYLPTPQFELADSVVKMDRRGHPGQKIAAVNSIRLVSPLKWQYQIMFIKGKDVTKSEKWYAENELLHERSKRYQILNRK